MARFFVRFALFVLMLWIAYPAVAKQCPPGFPPGVTCNGLENYTFTSPPASQPFTSNLRIPAAPSPADGSLLYIPSDLLATMNDTQTLTNKTIDCHNNTCINFPVNIAATPPLNFAGANLSLSIDSTLSVIGGQLHVISAGGGGGGITQLFQDVTAGPATGSVAATVTGLQGRPISTTAPVPGQFLGWNGSAWIPVTGGGGGGITQLTQDVTVGPATGSATAVVTGLQGRSLSSTPPTSGQCLGWNGSTWLPVTCGTGGGAVSSVSGSGQITASPTTGAVIVGSTGFSGGITETACTGTGCTPATSCKTFVNGIMSNFTTGACTTVATNFLLIQSGSSFLIQTGSHLLIQ